MKTLLITGASGGVARLLAREMAGAGWRIVRVARDSARLGDDTGVAPTDDDLVADVSTEAGAQAALEFVAQRVGAPPDAVAHCAGSSLIAPIGRTSESQYRAVLAANLDSAFFVSKAYAGALASAKRGGSLLLFSSVVAATGVANHAAIAAAKGGVEALTRALAADFSGLGLRVNCIAPGLMRTPMTARLLGNEASARAAAAQYPLGRHGEAEDAAALAAFLLSDAAGWITGQVIGLDGGFSAVRPYVKAG